MSATGGGAMTGAGSGEENGLVVQAESTAAHNAAPTSQRNPRSAALIKPLLQQPLTAIPRTQTTMLVVAPVLTKHLAGMVTSFSGKSQSLPVRCTSSDDKHFGTVRSRPRRCLDRFIARPYLPGVLLALVFNEC
jgi:hypothetical protein